MKVYRFPLFNGGIGELHMTHFTTQNLEVVSKFLTACKDAAESETELYYSILWEYAKSFTKLTATGEQQ